MAARRTSRYGAPAYRRESPLSLYPLAEIRTVVSAHLEVRGGVQLAARGACRERLGDAVVPSLELGR